MIILNGRDINYKDWGTVLFSAGREFRNVGTINFMDFQIYFKIHGINLTNTSKYFEFEGYQLGYGVMMSDSVFIIYS